MISITIELMGALRNPFPNKKRKNILNLQSTVLLSDFLKKIGFDSKELNHLITIVNGNRVNLFDYYLENGDHIFITLPFGGGSIKIRGLI